jgi:hypothetical protein
MEPSRKNCTLSPTSIGGGDFDVYTASPDGEWTHNGTFDTAADAFDAALSQIEESEAALEDI